MCRLETIKPQCICSIRLSRLEDFYGRGCNQGVEKLVPETSTGVDV